MKYTNIQMEQMLMALAKHLDRTDIVGYAAARNTRILRDELTEYSEIKNELIRKYGEAEKDADGNPTGAVTLRFESEGYPKFMDGITPFMGIEHEPKLFTIKYEEAIGKLSGNELLEVEWMFED